MGTADRRPLDVLALRAGLRSPWIELEVRPSTGSTNADLLGAPPGSVLVAEYQTGGRGRLDRSWASPARAGLTFSVVLAPGVPRARWGWLPLLSGVALAEAVASVTGLEVALKWPNDLLARDGGKLAGILAQAAGEDVVIGIGLNVSTTRAELPVPVATSLELAGGAAVDRTTLLAAILSALGRRYQEWVAAEGDAQACDLASAYARLCSTIGQPVRLSTVEDGAADSRPARAIGIDAEGRLRLAQDGQVRVVAAGDVVHLRPVVAGRSANV